jgi:hypothetical protein
MKLRIRLLKKLNDDPAFEKGKFEEIFEDCIRKVNLLMVFLK